MRHFLIGALPLQSAAAFQLHVTIYDMRSFLLTPSPNENGHVLMRSKAHAESQPPWRRVPRRPHHRLRRQPQLTGNPRRDPPCFSPT